MSQSAVPTPSPDTDPPEAEIIVGPWVGDPNPILTYRSPLDADSDGRYPTVLRGGIVTDPDEIRAIRRSIEAHVEPGRFRAAWRRRLRALGRQGGQS